MIDNENDINGDNTIGEDDVTRDALEMANTANYETLRITQSSAASGSKNSTNRGGNDTAQKQQQQEVAFNVNRIDAMESEIGFDYQLSTNSTY